ncbi:DUF6493 family protein [Solirubrobacter taibaiensis]|nr:DUF6493 family protein [Solirubrobacter taibaiensis]
MSGVVRAVLDRQPGRVVRLVAGLSEPERRKLAPELLRLARTELEDLQAVALQVALAGTGTMAEIRRRRHWWYEPEPTIDVLLDRRPTWLPEYADWLLAAPELGDGDWSVVRAFVRAGAIPRPSNPNYLGALVSAGWRDAPDLVAHDPALVDDELWALLRSDTGTQSLRATDPATADRKGWNALFQDLVADGRMPRKRVLDALLDGLAADLSAYRAVWHTRLWKDLAPSPAELSERTDRLRVLLGAAEPPIVGFAVKELLRAKANVPPGDLAPVLTAASKTTVRGALKLLGEQPVVATIALGHPDADIQGEVLDRLERWTLDDATRDGLLRHLDVLAATQRPRAEALLGVALADVDESVEVDVSDIPEAIRAALNFGGDLPDAPVPGEPVLGEPVVPIASIEELAGELGEPWPEDRVLDAVLRFCDQPFPGAAERYPRPGELGMPTLQRLAYAWVNRELAPRHGRQFDEEQRVAQGLAGPLLALPTHVGGWIDPLVLVARMHEHATDSDLTRALKRLAPEHRTEALVAARAVPGRHGALLRCALGGDDVEGDDEAAVAARAVRLPPLIAVAARVRWEVARERWEQDRFIARSHPFKSLLMPDEFPLRRDFAAAGAIERISWNLGSTNNEDYLVVAVLESLIPATEPIAPLPLRLVTLALSSSAAREHLAAVDVLITAIDDGRIDTLPLEDLSRLKPNRLAARLGEVAAAGPLQRAVVRDFLDVAIDAFDTRPGPLLVLFDELCAQTDTGPVWSREHLRTLNHKAAKALVKREHRESDTEDQLALAARVRRARRWVAP